MAGAIFVNQATDGLLNLLKGMDPNLVKNAIAGTSSGFFRDLTAEQQAEALDIIVHAIDNVYVIHFLDHLVKLTFPGTFY